MTPPRAPHTIDLEQYVSDYVNTLEPPHTAEGIADAYADAVHPEPVEMETLISQVRYYLD